MKILIHYQKLFLLLIILTKPIVNPYFPKKDDKYLIDDRGYNYFEDSSLSYGFNRKYLPNKYNLYNLLEELKVDPEN